MKFNTKVNADVYQLNKLLNINSDVDINARYAEMNVEWLAEMEVREWGIKDILAYVTSVSGAIYWEVCGDELTDSDKAEIKAAGGREDRSGDWSGSYEVKDWEVEEDINFADGNRSMTINTVEIDCKKKNNNC